MTNPRSPTGLPTATRRHSRPLSADIADDIAREFIWSGAVVAGEHLPPEKELSRLYGASRVTVREALLVLQYVGLVEMRHGIGTIVLPRPHAVTHGLDRLGSIDMFAHEAGETLEDVDLAFEVVEADAQTLQRLELSPGAEVLAVKRIKSLNGNRIGIVHDFVAGGVLPFDTITERFAGSTLDVFLDDPTVAVEYGDSIITPVNLTARMAATLGVKSRDAALMIDTVAFTSRGRPVDWGVCWLLPEYFHFAVRRREQFGRRRPRTYR